MHNLMHNLSLRLLRLECEHNLRNVVNEPVSHQYRHESSPALSSPSGL